MSNHDAVEAALNQYSLLLTGEHIGDFNEADQDGMREELYALLELMRPDIEVDVLRETYQDLYTSVHHPDNYIAPKMYRKGLTSAVAWVWNRYNDRKDQL